MPATPSPSEPPKRPTPGLLGRLLRKAREPAADPFRVSRIEVRPPAMWGQAESVWSHLWDWLRQSDAPAQRPVQTLSDARRDFCDALDDLITRDATDLRRRGEHARSLRELWHLRPELYSVVARRVNQSEADRRVGLLNRHFPTSATPALLPTASTSRTHDRIA